MKFTSEYLTAEYDPQCPVYQSTTVSVGSFYEVAETMQELFDLLRQAQKIIDREGGEIHLSYTYVDCCV